MTQNVTMSSWKECHMVDIVQCYHSSLFKVEDQNCPFRPRVCVDNKKTMVVQFWCGKSLASWFEPKYQPFDLWIGEWNSICDFKLVMLSEVKFRLYIPFLRFWKQFGAGNQVFLSIKQSLFLHLCYSLTYLNWNILYAELITLIFCSCSGSNCAS